ncbi:MAG TPA: hypothetical protein VFZ24_09055 [Longimicrobiales bacterium]
MPRSSCVPLLLILAGASAIGGCGRSPAAEPDYVPVASRGLLSLCQTQPEVEVTGTAGADGGYFEGGGVTVSIPPGALAEPTGFEMRVPSSPHAEVEIRADGQDHFRFLLPVIISISYDDCATPAGTLAAWHIDPETKVLLEKMGGVDDVVHRRIVFSTMHLSGYAIAN